MQPNARNSQTLESLKAHMLVCLEGERRPELSIFSQSTDDTGCFDSPPTHTQTACSPSFLRAWRHVPMISIPLRVASVACQSLAAFRAAIFCQNVLNPPLFTPMNNGRQLRSTVTKGTLYLVPPGRRHNQSSLVCKRTPVTNLTPHASGNALTDPPL